MSSEMRPCPACGEAPPRFDGDAYQCDGCGLRAPFAQTIPAGFSAKAIAAENWNALLGPRDVEAQRDRLVTEFRTLRQGNHTMTFRQVAELVDRALADFEESAK